MSDTSTEAVERLTYSLDSLAQYVHLPDVDKGVYGEVITLLLALAAERDALRAALEYYAGDVGNGDVTRAALNAYEATKEVNGG